MFLGLKSSVLLRCLQAGAVLGAASLIVTDASAQSRTPARTAPRNVRLVQNEALPPAPPIGGVDEIAPEGIEAPLTAQEPAAPAAEPAYLQADVKDNPIELPADEPWTLTNLFNDPCGGNFLKDNGFKLSGWSQWGYISGPDGSFNGNGPFVNQQEFDMFGSYQNYVFLERIADGSKGLDWGVRADVMYGLDGNDAQAFGNVNAGHWDYLNGFDHGAYEWALPQVYGEVAYDKLSVKIGHFYTIEGYEVVPSIGNYFFTRTLNFWNSEPFTHTGFLASYKATDKFTAMGGWVAGWDTGFYQYDGGSAFLGGFTWKATDRTDIVYAINAGNLGWRGDGMVSSLIVSHKWTDKFQTVHQLDVLDTNLTQADGTPASFTDPNSLTPRDSLGFINYAFYELTPKVRAGLRYEWYKADGTSYNTITGGFNLKPTNWLLVRPEVRGMWSPGNQNVYPLGGGTGAHGYQDKLFNATLFGIDAIVMF